MQLDRLAVGILVVWRITHLLQAEDGPWDVVVRLRRRAGYGFWGKLLDCFYCLSLWVAFPVALGVGHGWANRLLLWPALSGGAILLERATAPALERATAPAAQAAPPIYYEEPPKGEKENGVLRTS